MSDDIKTSKEPKAQSVAPDLSTLTTQLAEYIEPHPNNSRISFQFYYLRFPGFPTYSISRYKRSADDSTLFPFNFEIHRGSHFFKNNISSMEECIRLIVKDVKCSIKDDVLNAERKLGYLKETEKLIDGIEI